MSTPSNKKPLIIFGLGQIAEMAWHSFTHDSEYEVVAFAADRDYLGEESSKFGVPVVPFDSLAAQFPPESHKMFVAMAYGKVNQQRAQTVARVVEAGYTCANYVSSKALVAGEIAPDSNCFILELNNIQPFAKIGRNVWLWSGNHVGHHAQIEDNCFIASHVVISGAVKVGTFTFIGVNATIRDNVAIGASNVIGAGALILADTEASQVFLANKTEPSRVPSHRLRGI